MARLTVFLSIAILSGALFAYILSTDAWPLSIVFLALVIFFSDRVAKQIDRQFQLQQYNLNKPRS